MRGVTGGGPSASAQVANARVNARAEDAPTLYAATATQAAVQRGADATLRAQRIEIERVRAPVHVGVARLQAALTAAEETYVAAPASRDRADTQEIAGGLRPIRA